MKFREIDGRSLTGCVSVNLVTVRHERDLRRQYEIQSYYSAECYGAMKRTRTHAHFETAFRPAIN